MTVQAEPGGITKTYTDYNNNKIKVITTSKGTQTYFYDNIGRLEKIDFEKNSYIMYYYDDTAGNRGIGEMTKVKKQNIYSTAFVYGAYGRLLKEIKNIREINKSYTPPETVRGFVEFVTTISGFVNFLSSCSQLCRSFLIYHLLLHSPYSIYHSIICKKQL